MDGDNHRAAQSYGAMKNLAIINLETGEITQLTKSSWDEGVLVIPPSCAE